MISNKIEARLYDATTIGTGMIGTDIVGVGTLELNLNKEVKLQLKKN